jgi:acetyl esterase
VPCPNAIPSTPVEDFLVPVTAAMLEEARRVNAGVEAQLAAVPSTHTVDPAVTRAEREAGRAWAGPVIRSERATTRAVAAAAGPVPLRVVLPAAAATGVFLHIHGGGWVLGAADQQDLLLVALADVLGVAAVSVDYRLAPEHPFPAGPDDCEAAAVWLVEHCREEFGTDRLLIGGESAGAHLASLTLLRLRDRHGVTGAFAGANLVFGAFDVALTPSARLWGERNLVLSTPIMEWFSSLFTPGMSDEERRDPSVSPLYAPLRDMPPALFTVGSLDPLLDDTLFMAARWRAAGNHAELRVFPESPHGFIRFPTAITGLALDTMLGFLRGALAGP